MLADYTSFGSGNLVPSLPPSLPPTLRPEVDSPDRHQLVPAAVVIVLFDITDEV